MTRYVAFLRAINVGGRTVRMEQLRAIFTAAGFAGVETFIASGNVIFCSESGDPRALEVRIEDVLRQALGYPVVAFVRSIAEVHKIADHQPFGEIATGPPKSTVYIIFLTKAPRPAARKELLAFRSDEDDFAVKGREVYWLRRGHLLESAFSGARLERSAGAATMRNRNTIVRLASKYPG